MVESESHGSFVARIWLEGDSSNSLRWRGHVQNIKGDEGCYFQDLSVMKKFLERVSGVSLPDNEDDDE